MKHSIDEYKNIMDRIEPSESFISETEKLMKKIRDEQYEKETNKEINKAEEIKISIVDNEKEDRVKRIKKWTIGVSAVAAAFVCVITVGYTGRVRVKENMTKPEESETVETESEIASETSEKFFETTALTEETEADFIDDEETTFDDEEFVEAEESFDDMAEEETLENTEGKPQDGINSKNSAVNETQDGQTVTETASDDSNEEIAAEKSEESEDNSEIVSYEEDGGESSESEYNTAEVPIYVPPLYEGEEYEDMYEEDYEYDEYVYDNTDTTDSGYEDGVMGNGSISFLSVSYSEEYEKADEVYVPDSIAELDEGEYYIDVEAGYVSYSGDEMTVPYISLSDRYSCGEIINEFVSVTESCSGVYTETEQTSVNYRYKISIYSSDVNENNALLFEIYYDDEKVIFNRHDNDTVSSETYFIESENYDALTECIESIISQ